MKIKNLTFLTIYFCTLILPSCTESEPSSPDRVITDISVTSSVNAILWVDQNDFNQQLEAALSYNYGDALESEVETSIIYANDTSEVTVTIDFKAAFQSAYFDSNKSNNSVTIVIEKEQPNSNVVVLRADGPGGTYDLITSVLAPGANPIEVPDCNHIAFGDHIDEIWDSELNAHVFQFYIHTEPDNDRCIVFDRQRNEIKSYGSSPDNLLGIEEETVVYKWKFKLPAGFQSSPNFTHLHQLKSVGGSLASMPMYTLTSRKSNPDRLELRYAETDRQVTLAQTDLAPLIDVWMEVTETIKYGTSGTYAINIKRVDDATVLFEYSNSSIINWRPDASFVRPKWGIYRSLANAQDLRDEAVLFADFSVEEL